MADRHEIAWQNMNARLVAGHREHYRIIRFEPRLPLKQSISLRFPHGRQGARGFDLADLLDQRVAPDLRRSETEIRVVKVSIFSDEIIWPFAKVSRRELRRGDNVCLVEMMDRIALGRAQEKYPLAVVLPECAGRRAYLIERVGEQCLNRECDMAIKARDIDNRRAIVP